MKTKRLAALLPLAVAVVVVLVLFQAGTGAREAGQLTPDEPHPADACSTPYHLAGAQWDLCWQLDEARAQGVEINQAYFQNRSVAWKMGFPMSLTKYEGELVGPWKDTLGRPGDGGHTGYGRGAMVLNASDCPRFYGEGTLLRSDTLCVEERGGPDPALAVWARFDIFNYRFIQGWQFDDRGHIHPVLLMGGTLIDGNIGTDGQNHLHHPYWRIDLDVGADGNDTAQSFFRASTPTQPVTVPLLITSPVHPPSTSSLGVDSCRLERKTPAGWCSVLFEGKSAYSHEGTSRWRVLDTADKNARTHPRGYELFQHSETAMDGFSTTDAMILEYKGDSTELGYEVPTRPKHGDAYMDVYLTPPEKIDDPVIWLAAHVYHDTRDEDRGSMSYHYVSPELRPHNFVAENPGEPTFP